MFFNVAVCSIPHSFALFVLANFAGDVVVVVVGIIVAAPTEFE